MVHSYNFPCILFLQGKNIIPVDISRIIKKACVMVYKNQILFPAPSL